MQGPEELENSEMGVLGNRQEGVKKGVVRVACTCIPFSSEYPLQAPGATFLKHFLH